jgi:hypothetical protein
LIKNREWKYLAFAKSYVKINNLLTKTILAEAFKGEV